MKPSLDRAGQKEKPRRHDLLARPLFRISPRPPYIASAPLGHASTQAPQSMQSASFTTATASGTSIAWLGQESTQALQAEHFSASTFTAMTKLRYNCE
jgi:hypothetical protein